ncbi:50S ribosomal protein L30 [Streptomyces sp. MB09-01]|uniref:50S ribosomal protein L30 n=1 Tax=Streptomyces sp. MB09-01 TaxID=3028666 RepID=UPI0029B9AEF1|nr:50S ribosomal protein L30 [Streptomyces sp. MB09-01]MDX3533570.1 50S ribosomal protein L30 [Streptomyces sp. MB09-01]
MARIEDQALVVQTRSAIGRGEKQRATLRSLGLRHIGDIAQRDISNPCVVGMIRSVQHLIRVYPYPSVPLSHSARVETPNLLVRKYGTDQWPARHVEAGNAEYVRIEANGDALGLGYRRGGLGDPCGASRVHPVRDLRAGAEVLGGPDRAIAAWPELMLRGPGAPTRRGPGRLSGPWKRCPMCRGLTLRASPRVGMVEV